MKIIRQLFHGKNNKLNDQEKETLQERRARKEFEKQNSKYKIVTVTDLDKDGNTCGKSYQVSVPKKYLK